MGGGWDQGRLAGPALTEPLTWGQPTSWLQADQAFLYEGQGLRTQGAGGSLFRPRASSEDKAVSSSSRTLLPLPALP